MTDEVFNDSNEGYDLALRGDTIRKRHIATRASNRRRIIVLVVGDAEFEGYSIGLDSKSLQLLELPSGEVSSIALEYIVAITDGKPFAELTADERNTVDRRTASFRKTSHSWLVRNWPNVYDRRDSLSETDLPNSRLVRREYQGRRAFENPERRSGDDADTEVRDGAGQGGDQG